VTPPGPTRARLPGALAALLALLLALADQAGAQELLPGSRAGDEGGSLRVAAVQLAVNAEMLGSLEAYRGCIAEKVAASLAFQPELIVFPEYTAAFLALIPHRGELDGALSVAEGLERIRAKEPLVESLHEVFLLNSGWTERALEAVFGGLARRHGVAIVAGSYFAWTAGEDGPRLVNRAVVFGADGSRTYQQDKVFLTPFEQELLGLSPGRLSEARPFRVAGARVGMTICRDGFFPDWEQRLADSDLWVEIKANGTAFTEEERQRFQRALPARIGSGEVPFGLTVCLTGEFLDLLWEGESSLVQKVGPADGAVPGTATLQATASPREEEILLLSVPVVSAGR